MAEFDPLSSEAWAGRRDACRHVRKTQFIPTWQDSVAYRRGKPFRVAPSDDTINVPIDWSRTKNKTAQLFYQVPEVRLKARRPEYRGATAVFAAALNFELTKKVKAEHMMNEVLGDVINAAGVGICKVGYEATFEDVEMPLLPPEQAQMLGLPPEAIPTEKVPRPLYQCYYARRIAPQHFLWPVEFTGSNWQEAPWLGWEGYMPLADARRKGWVDETFEGEGMTDPDWYLVKDFQDQQRMADRYVKYCEIFYRPYCFDPNEKDHRKIKRLVLVDGLKEPKVVDEDFEWQRYVEETRSWVGMTTFPIKVLTITNISDMAIPPSDSEISRPQVREIIKGRSQMMKQRDHSLPLRWFDVNAVDPVIADKLRKGKWQDMIPMNGPGSNAIGEISRANYPRENFSFDEIAKRDLDDAWSMGDPQQGSKTEGETTATEVRTMTQALNVRLDYERSWVLRFFVEVAEGVASLMQLFSDDQDYVEVIGKDGLGQLQAWNKDTIQGDFVFETKPDSQLKIDINQRKTEGVNLYKFVRRDPLVNPTEMLQQLLEMHGFDPVRSMAQPKAPTPPPPKINFSFKEEALINPLAVATMTKAGVQITPEDIQAAALLIQQATQAAMNAMTPQPAAPGQPQVPGEVTGETQPHPGPVKTVEPIDQRYGQGPPVETSEQNG